jgi:hypothetical protein
MVSFHLSDIEIEPRFAGADIRPHDLSRVDFTQSHPDQGAHPYPHPREQRRNPETDWHKVEKESQRDDDQQRDHGQSDGPGFHG